MTRTSRAPVLPRRTVLVLAAIITAITSACASSGHAGQTSGTSCVSQSASGYLALAHIAFTGVMLPGPTVTTSQGGVLASPARVRVIQYLKGGGPRIVTVVTAAARNGSGVTFSEDGIEAHPGQRWRIYITRQQTPYQTSVCAGSTPAT